MTLSTNDLRLFAEDLHSPNGPNKYSGALSLAADEIDHLRGVLEQQASDAAKILEWQSLGERLIAGKGTPMFHIGAWWADRPWRKRPGEK